MISPVVLHGCPRCDGPLDLYDRFARCVVCGWQDYGGSSETTQSTPLARWMREQVQEGRTRTESSIGAMGDGSVSTTRSRRGWGMRGAIRCWYAHTTAG